MSPLTSLTLFASPFHSIPQPRAKQCILTAALVLLMVFMPKPAAAQHIGISFQLFYDQLSPYGQWVDYPEYGYAWIPNEGSDFVPYSSRGHWIYTDYGWTWVSDYRWGWAPFHYGRWAYDDYYGWLWVPDNEWGPSWVTWRRSEGYYGWAPMGPGITISLSFGGHGDRDRNHWMFVRDRDIERGDIQRYYVNRNEHNRIIQNSTVINQTYIDKSRNTTYIAGPRREDVQRATGRSVRPYAVQDNSSPGQNLQKDRLEIYRPRVERGDKGGRKAAPSRVSDRKDVKRPSERKPAATAPQTTRESQRSAQQPATKPNENKQRERKP
ncbi:MAG: DUF6600 domain-containing protein, partial [Bacteroidota bacterium]